MRILLLTYRFPFPHVTADRHTTYQFVKYFSRNHEVHLRTFDPFNKAEDFEQELEPYCTSLDREPIHPSQMLFRLLIGLPTRRPLQVSLFRSKSFRKAVEHAVEERNIDIVFSYHLRMAQYAKGHSVALSVGALQPAQVLHLDRMRTNVSNLRRPIYELEFQRMRKYEASIARELDMPVVISEKDARAIDPDGAIQSFFINPHGVDFMQFQPCDQTEKETKSIVFAGCMHSDSNIDAVLFFSREILPRIWAEEPDTRFWVVGHNPPQSVRVLAEDVRITVTGSVPDILPYLQTAEVSVDPLRIGAGLQNKILEAMSTGLPVVATSIANEGIMAKKEHGLLTADSPDDFADAVVALLRDPSMRNTYGVSARQFITDNWGWDRFFYQLEEQMESRVRS